MSTLSADATTEPHEAPDGAYSRWRLTFGIVGRTWLWFMAGCLLVTLIPILFGWRPFLIESGSMQPRIKVGDVVLSAPTHASDADLVGHVVVFDDPDFAGRVKTHRVVAVADGGGLVTKGDANLTNDSMTVPRDHVIGLGRLLVRYVGLPVIWLHEGQWLYLALFCLSLLLAALVVNRDRETDPDPSGPDDPGDAGPGDSGASPTPLPSLERADTPTTIAATKPFRLTRVEAKTLGFRLAGVAAMCLMLLAPTTVAAFAATTKNTADTWTVPNWSYSTEAKNLGPYLYWKLDETGTATAAADSSGNGHPGTYNTNGSTTYFTRLTDGALVTDTPDNAVTLNNAASCINTTSTTLINAPATTTVVIWFKAPTTYATGGKLAGFEKPQAGVAAPSTGTYDRHLYMDGAGRVWFGVYNGTYVTLESTMALNDGAWHMAVGSVGATGTRLYIDGVLNASNATNTAAEATTGVWRAGCGNLGGWGGSWTGGNTPGTNSAITANRPFMASLDEFAVYTTQLTATDVAFLYWIR
jgi:signal peptidase I